MAQLVGRSWGVGHVFVGRCVLTFAEFLAENTPKDGRYFLFYTQKLISMSLTRQICTHHFFSPVNVER